MLKPSFLIKNSELINELNLSSTLTTHKTTDVEVTLSSFERIPQPFEITIMYYDLHRKCFIEDSMWRLGLIVPYLPEKKVSTTDTQPII